MKWLYADWQDRGAGRFIILIELDYWASDDFKMLCLPVEAKVIICRSKARAHNQRLTRGTNHPTNPNLIANNNCAADRRMSQGFARLWQWERDSCSASCLALRLERGEKKTLNETRNLRWKGDLKLHTHIFGTHYAYIIVDVTCTCSNWSPGL